MRYEALVPTSIYRQCPLLTYIPNEITFITRNRALGYAQKMYSNGEFQNAYNFAPQCQSGNFCATRQPSVGFLAVERLQQNINHFELGTALYNSNNGILTVSDLLKIIKFALSCLQFMTGIDTSKERQTITALRRLELLLSNQQSDLDGIGYVAEILSAISEQMTMNPVIKQNILGFETTFLMACDFFSR